MQKSVVTSLHLLVKMALALGIAAFSGFYRSLPYNLAVSLLVWMLLRRENVRLFRFPRQGYFLAFFLVSVFCFRAMGGFGQILVPLPRGLSVTVESAAEGLLFVSQLLLIFLVFGMAVYANPTGQMPYFLQALHRRFPRWEGGLRMARIGLFAVWLLPRFLPGKPDAPDRAALAARATGRSWREKLSGAGAEILDFFEKVLSQAELEYAGFLMRNRNAGESAPVSLGVMPTVAVVAVVIASHLFLWSLR
ncbi:MAG TPA: hypothetical protein PKV71_15305 [Calditrichia bacterium]|nr:hypothetical protein [Calditrichia bacterium]